MGAKWVRVVALLVCFLACPLVAYVPDSGPSGPAGGWLWSFGGVFPSFCPLCCSSLGALSTNMALFRVLRAFLEGFVGFVWVCVVLVLCVDCGAFVCVRG